MKGGYTNNQNAHFFSSCIEIFPVWYVSSQYLTNAYWHSYTLSFTDLGGMDPK
jgi:hypothetical protein